MPGKQEYDDTFAKAKEAAQKITEEFDGIKEVMEVLSHEAGPRPQGGAVTDQYPAAVFKSDFWEDLRDKFVELRQRSEKLKSVKGMGQNAGFATKLDQLCQQLKDACFRLLQQSTEHRGSSDPDKVRFESWEPVTTMWLFATNYDSLMFKDFDIPALDKAAVGVDFDPSKIDTIKKVEKVPDGEYHALREPKYRSPTIDQLKDDDVDEKLTDALTYKELDVTAFGNLLSWALVKKDVTEFIARDKDQVGKTKQSLKTTKETYDKAWTEHKQVSDRTIAANEEAALDIQIRQLETQEEQLRQQTAGISGEPVAGEGGGDEGDSPAVQQLKSQLKQVEAGLTKNDEDLAKIPPEGRMDATRRQAALDQLGKTRQTLEQRQTQLRTQLAAQGDVDAQQEEAQRSQHLQQLDEQLKTARAKKQELAQPAPDAVQQKEQAMNEALSKMQEAFEANDKAEKEFVSWLNDEQDKRVTANTARLEQLVKDMQTQTGKGISSPDAEFLKDMSESMKGRNDEMAKELEEMESSSH